jgi:hypothetical protein
LGQKYADGCQLVPEGAGGQHEGRRVPTHSGDIMVFMTGPVARAVRAAIRGPRGREAPSLSHSGGGPMDGDGLPAALHAAGPADPHAEELHLFGQFIGSWDIAWSGLDGEGRTLTARGELHFGWVLGGRAVQDVCIVPGRGERAEGGSPLAFHGSTVRFYDASLGAWRSTWIDPVNNRVRRFTGRRAGDDILLLSDEDEPQLRWRFTDIKADSFTWRGETSRDGGATWIVDEEMRINRKA